VFSLRHEATKHFQLNNYLHQGLSKTTTTRDNKRLSPAMIQNHREPTAIHHHTRDQRPEKRASLVPEEPRVTSSWWAPPYGSSWPLLSASSRCWGPWRTRGEPEENQRRTRGEPGHGRMDRALKCAQDSRVPVNKLVYSTYQMHSKAQVTELPESICTILKLIDHKET